MNNTYIENLKKKYTPIIKKILEDNKRFFDLSWKIDWEFFVDERVSIIGFYSRALKKLQINLYAVDFAYTEKNEPLQIEYFIIHEARHYFQDYCIEIYDTNHEKCPVSHNLIQDWKNGFKNYTKPINGQSNKEYYFNPIEKDAFLFSYSVMQYKYGEIPYITLPNAYNDCTQIRDKKFCTLFKEQNL